MAGNKAVAYIEPGKVEVQTIDYPKLELQDGPGVNPANVGRKTHHGVILKVVSTNICGSDQHMVRGRTTAPAGLVLGHEITGEIIEKGRDVEFLNEGDIVSIPFNIACGRCRNCKERHTGVCENVNPDRPGSAYGYVDMGGWVGGQAEYVLVPYADFNCLKFPDRDQALEKIRDLTMLSDIFPTGYHGAYTAGVTTGSTVYVAGAGPVGLACAYSCQLLGAAVVIVGDMIEERLAQARSFGCETIDLKAEGSIADHLDQILGVPEVDAAVDCVGFEARPRAGRRPRGAGHRPQLDHGHHQGGGQARHPGPVRHRRSGRDRRRRQGRLAEDPHRPRLGEVARAHDRPVPGDALPPRPDDVDPPRQGPHRRRGERHRHHPGRRPSGLQGLRPGRGQEVRARPARHDQPLSVAARLRAQATEPGARVTR
jgi:glutathione-independent formaldehyde dehydrogenase